MSQSFFFWSSKIFFLLLFENGHIHNVVKHRVENNNIVSMLSNVVNINVDSTLFYVVNFSVDIYNIVSTLIWHCPTSWRHTTLTTTLRQRWNVCWVLQNVAKRLHNFVKFIKLKTYIFSRIPLNCFFRKLLKRYW